MKKTAAIIFVIVVGVGAFYGGMKYGLSKAQSDTLAGDFRNLSPEQRQQRFQQMGGPGGGQGMRAPGGFGSRDSASFITGEILSKDDKSVTVKLRDNGSKLVFYSASTEISKFASGTPDDLQVGKSIMVNAKTNADNSVTAQSIQLRPDTARPSLPQMPLPPPFPTSALDESKAEPQP